MKGVRLSILFVLIRSLITVSAQTQQGYIKTLGRPDKKGVALSGVSVRVKGEHNPVISKNNGTFGLFMKGKKNGDAYSLQQVQKQGYELNEMDIIGRQYAFSDNVPLTIVMVSSAQLQADKQRIENNAYKVAERNYKAQLALLERQLSESEITNEKYREELRDLQDKFEKYQSLIDGLTEHYAHVDYDCLDEKDRKINICIENGELERADSLIHILFDPVGVLRRNKEALSKIEQQVVQAKGIITQANTDMTKVLKQQEKDAEHLYQLYTIALAKFENEKARKYIETRAALDTMNVRWQIEAGKFLEKYQAVYDEALSYYRTALKCAIYQKGNHSNDVANCYLNIGYIYHLKGDLHNAGLLHGKNEYFEKALDYYSRALSANDSLNNVDGSDGDFHLYLGHIYNDMEQYPNAVNEYNKALAIYKSAYGDLHPNIALCYMSMSIPIYNIDKRKSLFSVSDSAVNCLENATRIYKTIHQTEDFVEIAKIYMLKGMVYGLSNQNKEAECYREALRIMENVYGKNLINEDYAQALNSLGGSLNRSGNYQQAVLMYEKALDIFEILLNEYHPRIALTCENLNGAYSNLGNKIKALIYLEKAANIWKNTVGKAHPQYEKIIELFQGHINYLFTNKNENKEQVCKEAIEIYRRMAVESPREIEPYLASLVETLARCYINKEQYIEAKKTHEEALNILKNLKGVDPLRLEIEVAKMEMRWGIIMADVNNYTEAIKSCNNACLIFKRAVSTVPSIQRYYYTALNYLARLYLGTGNYKKAYNVNTEILSFLSKKYELDGKSERKNYASAIANHSLIYIYMKNYSEAESWSQKGLGVDSTDINNKTYYNISLFLQGKLDIGKTDQWKDDIELIDSISVKLHRLEEMGAIPTGREKDLNQLKEVLEKQSITFRERYVNQLLYAKALKEGNMAVFLSQYAFTATVLEGDTPARQQGMSGEYILLEFGDWNQNTPMSLFDKNKEMRGKPKDILVMKDGIITQHHFEDTIGVQIGIKEVGKEVKLHINKAYEEWKKQN